MKGDHIGEFEELILLAIHGLADRAYSVEIAELLTQETTRTVSIGAVYGALDRLSNKRLLASRLVAGEPVRGGRSRRAYTLTDEGHRTIESLRRVRERLYRARSQAAKGRA